MKNAITIILLDRRPPSGQETYVGRHWSKRAAMARDWHEVMQVALLGVRCSQMTNCAISIIAEMKKPLFDSDNVSPKPLIDGMKRWRHSKVKGKIVKEENRRWIFVDDRFPYVGPVTTHAIPGDRDKITITVTGDLVP